MLSIQPKISDSFNPAFKMADRKIVNEENDFDPYIDEDTYERTKDELEEQKPRRNINVLGLVDIFVDRGPFHLPLLCRALCRQAQAERKSNGRK